MWLDSTWSGLSSIFLAAIASLSRFCCLFVRNTITTTTASTTMTKTTTAIMIFDDVDADFASSWDEAELSPSMVSPGISSVQNSGQNAGQSGASDVVHVPNSQKSSSGMPLHNGSVQDGVVTVGDKDAVMVGASVGPDVGCVVGDAVGGTLVEKTVGAPVMLAVGSSVVASVVDRVTVG